MTPQEIAIVQRTYRTLEPHSGLFAQALYDRLFSDNPNVSLMFEKSIEEQSMQFRVMLFTAVNGISRSEELKPALRNLGQRHVSYGVRPGDFIAFESALLWALERFLGDDFTPEVRHAWKAFYGFICSSMLEGVNRQAAFAWERASFPEGKW